MARNDQKKIPYMKVVQNYRGIKRQTPLFSIWRYMAIGLDRISRCTVVYGHSMFNFIAYLWNPLSTVHLTVSIVIFLPLLLSTPIKNKMPMMHR